MEINKLVYGNPSRPHLIYLKSENYLDSLLEELSSYVPPKNDSEDTKKELETLVEYTNFLSQDEKLQKRFELYDIDFEGYIINNLVNSAVPEKKVRELVVELHKDVVPILIKLKYTFNRCRPYQLAHYHNVALHPFRSKSADSPSYPSGHCFQSRIYAEVLGNIYPKFYKALSDLATDISWSRQYLGLHFPSDTEFSNYAAEIVLKHPDFRKKYKL
jgi:hypothetical protein